MTSVIEPHYFPNLEYFCAIADCGKIALERFEHYPKQTLRNRCYVNTVHGPIRLTIPLEEKSGKVLMKDVRVQKGNRWRNNHWRTIQSAYAKAPYFEHYADDVRQIIFCDTMFLFELDMTSMSFCLRSLKWQKEVTVTETYTEVEELGVSDLRSQISDKNHDTTSLYYRPMPYYQVFGSGFASNLSLLDVLFCEGPGAPAILKASERRI